ncbi:PadR family transcriptional regulator [Paenibacillus thiaminolyticus]|uniref:PadR family transcriptional regulator n=1 Tax=Paenibacillus thiaminolyticus TaxID=49283 RepID=UPI003D6D663C
MSGGPRSGYDIRKQFQASLRHFWSESYGQIYPALKELLWQGYTEELAPRIIGATRSCIG